MKIQMKVLVYLFAATIFLAFTVRAIGATASDLVGKVILIESGDTFVMLGDGLIQKKLRLDGVAAPKTDQTYGYFSKEHLGKVLLGKGVTLTRERLSDGRVYNKVSLNGVDVSELLVSEGYLWALRDEGAQPHLIAAEESARQNKRGFWAVEGREHIHPSKWDAYVASQNNRSWFDEVYDWFSALLAKI